MENVNNDGFKNLPTETLMLDMDFRIIDDLRIRVERNYDEYYLATCHYVVANNEKQYYLSENKIKNLLLMKKDAEPGYPHYVAKIKRYGVEG